MARDWYDRQATNTLNTLGCSNWNDCDDQEEDAMSVTVQELIDILNRIDNKQMRVVVTSDIDGQIADIEFVQPGEAAAGETVCFIIGRDKER